MSDDEQLQRMAALMAEKGTPVGQLKGLLYGALLTAVGKSLPLRTHALVFIEMATKFAFAAGMSFEQFQGYALWGYQQAVKDAQLPPPTAPEPGAAPPPGQACRECGGPSDGHALCDGCARAALEP